MAWTKVGQTTFTVPADAGGSDDITLPGTLAEHDIVIVLIGSDVTIARTDGDATRGIRTAGYNIIADNTAGSLNTLTNPGCDLSWKRMGSTPDTIVQIGDTNDSGTPRIIAGLIQVWRGADQVTAIDATPTTAVGASAQPNPPTYTPVTNGALVFAVGILDDDDVAASVTAPANYTNLLAADTGQASTTVGATVMIASRELAVAAAEDPAAFGGGGDEWAAITFALRPARHRRMLLGVGH